MFKLLQRWLAKPESGKTESESSEKTGREAVAPFLPEGCRLYCIGDIHGRLDLLEELHGMIEQDAGDFDGSKMLVYLGDYIDRGAQSRQVLDLLISRPLSGFKVVYLKGNHEQAMLDFLENPQYGAAWLSFGGQVTLLSYGVGIGKMMTQLEPEMLCDELEQKLPAAHLQFLNDGLSLYTEGSYCFVHAGIRPGVPIEEQQTSDLFWIREEFTRSRARHEFIIVHGHTISEEVVSLPNRIGIDTGAYESGLLTALVLEGREQRYLQTGIAG